jgi:hypothetical protein
MGHGFVRDRAMPKPWKKNDQRWFPPCRWQNPPTYRTQNITLVQTPPPPQKQLIFTAPLFSVDDGTRVF